MSYRCQLKPKTPSAGARFSYINRRGKYERQDDDLVYSADHNMPLFAAENAADFWFAADEFERSNARVCVEFELNLPAELDLKQQILCVESFIDSLNKKAGHFPISYAIHHDKNGANPHVHLMLSERTLDGIERPGELFFKRANSAKPELGGNKKSLFFNKSSENVLWTRASWAESCNNTLIENGFDARFDSRTKMAQREEAIKNNDLVRAVQLSTLTEKHEGPVRGSIRKRLASGALERDSVDLEVLQLLDSNDTIKDFNRELELFAVTASDDQLRAFLVCESAHDKLSFFIDMHHKKEVLEYEYNARAATRIIESRADSAGGIQQHIEYLSVLQARRNNELLREKKDKSASEQHRAGSAGVRDLQYRRMAVCETTQSRDRDENAGLHNVRKERVDEPTLTHHELFELYKKADDEADTAELQADVANCKHDDLKAEGRELIAQIKASKPSLIQRTLIKMGLLSDRSAQLKNRVKPLVRSIREAEIELKQLDKKARDLRSDADKLKIKVDLAQKSKKDDEIDSTQDAHAAAQLCDAGHELDSHDKSATASAQESMNSFFSSSGYLAQTEQNISEQSKVTKKSSAPRL